MSIHQQEISTTLGCYKDTLPKPDQQWPPLVRRSVIFIHEHLYDPRLTVQWMKQNCRLGGNGFSGKFKYYLGTPPKQYWLEHRVAVAKQLLGNDTLADVGLVHIAFSVGFQNHSSFSTTFKNYVGCPPSEFRNGMNGTM